MKKSVIDIIWGGAPYPSHILLHIVRIMNSTYAKSDIKTKTYAVPLFWNSVFLCTLFEVAVFGVPVFGVFDFGVLVFGVPVFEVLDFGVLVSGPGSLF